MKKGIGAIGIIIILAIIVGLTIWFMHMHNGSSYNNNNGNTNATSTQSLSDGTIQFNYPADFGLAVSQDQLSGMVKSYIPPCSEGFDYCLYYNGTDFAGTNFESAGIRISKRTDLKDETACLSTAPDSYPNMEGSTAQTATYSASIFSPIGDAGAGHYASGEIYRIYIKQTGKCYELETRIGETQYANYPEGSIKMFTEEDRNAVYSKFNSVLNSLEIASTSERIVLPVSEN